MKFTKKRKIGIVFLAAIIIGIGGSQKAYAKETNLHAVKELYPYATVKRIFGTGDITGELSNLLKASKSGTTVIIYITSGNYTIRDNGMLILHTNNIVVMEDNTNISKSGGLEAIFRTSASENARNVKIIGGKLDANGKTAVEINNAYNVKVQDTKITDAKCGVKTVRSTVNLQSIEVSKSTRGIYVMRGSHATINNVAVKANKQDGMLVAKESVVYVNNSSFVSNSWRGISATGAGTKIYVSGSTCARNGIKPKITKDGRVGHGIGITSGAYGEIVDSSITGNKECGISIFNGAKVKLFGNTISKNGRHGIGARKNVDLTDMKNNKIVGNGYNGILIADNSKMNSDHDQINRNNGIGISIVDASRVSLEQVDVMNNKTSNIWLSKGDAKKTGAYLNLKSGNRIQKAQQNDGIGVENNTFLEITGKNNTITGNKRNGITAVGRNARVEIMTGKVKVQKNGGDGIYLKGAKGKLKNVTVSLNRRNGIAVWGKSNLRIEKAIVNDNVQNGISISGQGTKANIISGTMSKNHGNGIFVTNKAQATMNAVKVENNEYSGVSVTKKAKVTSNRVKANKNGRYGVNAETRATVKIEKLSASGNEIANTHKSNATLKK
ncbi:right-handed parallel beta-helix repeat-containing protein [Lachnospiraceae bacterium ZAX-1]